MLWKHVIWSDRALDKIAVNGVTDDEVEQVVFAAKARTSAVPAAGRSTSAAQTHVDPSSWSSNESTRSRSKS